MTRLGFLLGDKVSEGPAGTQYSMEEPEARQVLVVLDFLTKCAHDDGFLLRLRLYKGNIVCGLCQTLNFLHAVDVLYPEVAVLLWLRF